MKEFTCISVTTSLLQAIPLVLLCWYIWSVHGPGLKMENFSFFETASIFLYVIWLVSLEVIDLAMRFANLVENEKKLELDLQL